MNLPPLRLYLKYGEERHHDEVVSHDATIGKLLMPIVARAFLHLTNTPVEAKETLLIDYTRVLAELVRHIDVSRSEVGSAFQTDIDDAVSALKAGQFMSVPSPYEVIEEAGERYVVVGVQALRVVVPGAGIGEYDKTMNADSWMDNAIRRAEKDARAYLEWLGPGMPERTVKKGVFAEDTPDLKARSRWHAEIAPGSLDVDQRKSLVEKYLAYLLRAGTIMERRRNLMKRNSDPRRRR